MMARGKKVNRAWENTKAAAGIVAAIGGSLSGPPSISRQMDTLGRRTQSEQQELIQAVNEAVRNKGYRKEKRRSR